MGSRAGQEKSEDLTKRLGDEIASVSRRRADHLAILSAENLANPAMAELFAGLDQQFELWVVFIYGRSSDGIPSAWKQCGLKRGVSLGNFVSKCIETHRPGFRLGIEIWERTLPGAGFICELSFQNCQRAGILLKISSTCWDCQKTSTTLKVSYCDSARGLEESASLFWSL